MLCEPCPTCEGRGQVKTARSVCYDILREILREARQFDPKEFRVVASRAGGGDAAGRGERAPGRPERIHRQAHQPERGADDESGAVRHRSDGGVAGWILRYRHGGRRRELTIGRYPDIGLAEARGIATLKRAEVQQGRNPAAEKQKAKATAARDWTVRDLAKDYRAKKLVSLAHSTQVSYGRHLKRVEKKLGALTVREIGIRELASPVERAGLTWGASNGLLITTKCLFTHACGKRLINANPCHGIMLSALLGERPPRRQRLMLTREELKLLLAAPMRRPT
jgi:hypothetical protein